MLIKFFYVEFMSGVWHDYVLDRLGILFVYVTLHVRIEINTKMQFDENKRAFDRKF